MIWGCRGPSAYKPVVYRGRPEWLPGDQLPLVMDFAEAFGRFLVLQRFRIGWRLAGDAVNPSMEA